MRLKNERINITKLHEMLKKSILPIENECKKNEGIKYQITITSGNDGKHMEKSLHYENRAIDVRINDMRHTVKNYKAIKKHLGRNFDVVLEKTHIHIEYQPK